MNQLTKMNNNNFTLEETLMQRVFEASGYNFTIITPNGGEPHFISQEVAKGLGYARNDYLTEKLKTNGFTLLKLTKENGLTLLKRVSSISKNIRSLMLIPASSLQEYLVKHSTKPKAKEIGNILYKCLTQPEKEVKKPENALQKLLRSEVEALQLGSEFRKWYLDKVEQSPYLKRMNYKRRSPNWLLCLMGFYNSLSSRFVVASGKNSAKKRLKKKGASSRMISSNRAIIRGHHPPSGDYWTLIVSEYMRHVDSIMFLFLLTIKPTSIPFAEGKDSSSYINNSCLV